MPLDKLGPDDIRRAWNLLFLMLQSAPGRAGIPSDEIAEMVGCRAIVAEFIDSVLKQIEGIGKAETPLAEPVAEKAKGRIAGEIGRRTASALPVSPASGAVIPEPARDRVEIDEETAARFPELVGKRGCVVRKPAGAGTKEPG